MWYIETDVNKETAEKNGYSRPVSVCYVERFHPRKTDDGREGVMIYLSEGYTWKLDSFSYEDMKTLFQESMQRNEVLNMTNDNLPNLRQQLDELKMTPRNRPEAKGKSLRFG